jgi:murein DD-endopeptidase
VSSPFGYRTHPVLGTRKLHTGVDLAVPVGTPVLAVEAATVRRASQDAINGKVLILDHGRGVTTAYCHNSELLVRPGQRVALGEPIARSGNTGRSTGPHLHYQLELSAQPVDPLRFRSHPGAVAGEPTR